MCEFYFYQSNIYLHTFYNSGAGLYQTHCYRYWVKYVLAFDPKKEIFMRPTHLIPAPVEEKHFTLTYEVHICVSIIRIRLAQSVAVTAGDDRIKEPQGVLLVGDWRGRRFRP